MMLWVGLVLTEGAASAGTVGVGLGANFDLRDGADSQLRTWFWPAGHLAVPLRFDASPNTAIRATVSGTFAIGEDLVSWDVPGVDRFTDNIRTLTGIGSATLGPEIRFTSDTPVVPYFVGAVGIAIVHNAHSEMLDHPELFDPAVYDEGDLSSRNTIDPWTDKLVPCTTVALGLHANALWAELGYDMAFVGPAEMRHSTPALGAVREGYGWNALSATIGLQFPLGQPPPPPPP
jgi:hypothetical protein